MAANLRSLSRYLMVARKSSESRVRLSRLVASDLSCSLMLNFMRPTREKSYRSEEHTSELQSLRHLVCRLLLEKKKWDSVAYDTLLSVCPLDCLAVGPRGG